MRYTKIITLTGSGISGSVRIEGSNGRTKAEVKIRQPVAKKLVLFLLSADQREQTELSGDLTGFLNTGTEADAALLAVNDDGVLRFIAEGRSLGCKTDLEKVKQDIRMRQNPVKTAVPAGEKHSLKAVASGEYKKPAKDAFALEKHPEEREEEAPLVRAVPMPSAMPETQPSAMPETEEKDAISDARGEPKKHALTSVRIPARRKRSIRELKEDRTPENEIEPGQKTESVEKVEPAADETPMGTGDVEDRKGADEPAAAEESVELKETVVLHEPAPDQAAESMEKKSEDDPRAADAAEPDAAKESAGKNDLPHEEIVRPEAVRSKALSDILDQARELFPSGYDRPRPKEYPGVSEESARAEPKGAKHLTPMQKNTKWDGEMEAVLKGTEIKTGKEAYEKPKQEQKQKQTARGEKQSPGSDNNSVPNPFPETFPNSKWRKVSYPGTNRYYLEGEASDRNGKFLIAALPGEYSAVPPQRAKGFNRFIRAADGCGYWLRIIKR